MSDDTVKNDDVSLFRSAMADVTPLKADNKVTLKKTAKKLASNFNREPRDFAIDDVFSDSEIIQDCPKILDFSRSGLPFKILKKLRQGNNPIEATLDLHGMTVALARNALIRFLGECEFTGIRHVIIIHGKGFRSKDKPVIKAMVNRWLQAADNVLAFHSAQAKDGGNGAVYVLLRKSPPDNSSWQK
jgi:DNA-nicking Smr family endonuclease